MKYNHDWPWAAFKKKKEWLRLNRTISVLLDLKNPEVLSAYDYAGRNYPPCGSYWFHREFGFTYGVY